VDGARRWGAAVVPLQVCEAEQIATRRLPLRDERIRKQERRQRPAVPSWLFQSRHLMVSG